MRTMKKVLKKLVSAYIEAMTQYGEAICMSKGV